MKPEKIKLLLQQAVGSALLNNRSEISEVLQILSQDLEKKFQRPDVVATSREFQAGIKAVMQRVYLEYINNKPELVPCIFPIFVMILGEPSAKNASIFGDIDWNGDQE